MTQGIPVSNTFVPDGQPSPSAGFSPVGALPRSSGFVPSMPGLPVAAPALVGHAPGLAPGAAPVATAIAIPALPPLLAELRQSVERIEAAAQTFARPATDADELRRGLEQAYQSHVELARRLDVLGERVAELEKRSDLAKPAAPAPKHDAPKHEPKHGGKGG